VSNQQLDTSNNFDNDPNQQFDLDTPGFFDQLQGDRPFQAQPGDNTDSSKSSSQDSQWDVNDSTTGSNADPNANVNDVQDFSLDPNWNSNTGPTSTGATDASSTWDDQISQFDLNGTVDNNNGVSGFSGGEVVNGSEPSSIDDLISNTNLFGDGREVVSQDQPFNGGSFAG
jgi:hypothetical protein